LRAQRQGWRVRVVFVDSRMAARAAALQPDTLAALAARGVALRAGGAVATRVAGSQAQIISMRPPVPAHISSGEAALLGALAAADADAGHGS
jgi:hypothetical protein